MNRETGEAASNKGPHLSQLAMRPLVQQSGFRTIASVQIITKLPHCG
jgi:hypothetical protein